MNLESVSKAVVYTSIVYVITLLYGLNFLLRNLSLAGYWDFWVAFVVVTLPIVFYVPYFQRLRNNEESSLLKWLLTITVVISVVFTVVFIIPISY